MREATAGDAQHVAVEKFRFPHFLKGGDTCTLERTVASTAIKVARIVFDDISPKALASSCSAYRISGRDRHLTNCTEVTPV